MFSALLCSSISLKTPENLPFLLDMHPILDYDKSDRDTSHISPVGINKGGNHLATDGYACSAWSLSNRIDLSRIMLMNFLSPDAQISPDKGMNFPCTTAAFTPSPKTSALPCVAGRLETTPSMRCLFPGSGPGQALARTFALRPPSGPSSRRRPCLRLVLLLVSIITMNTLRFSYRGLSPP
jgi:hypothetical protein